MSLENKLLMVMDRTTHKMDEKFVADYPNIRSLRGFLNGVWEFTDYDDCFNGKNRLSDVDASTEIEGHTLVVEFKGSKSGMNRGQILKAIRQAKHSGITTFFVFGPRNKPEGILKVKPAETVKGFTYTEYLQIDNEGLKEHFKKWNDEATRKSLVKNKTEEWNEVQEILSSLWNNEKIG